MQWRGGPYRGPLYGRGAVRGTTRRRWAPWRGRGYDPAIRRQWERAPGRGAWRWRGHGPDAWSGYGWEYRGGVPSGADVWWPEDQPGARTGGERWLAERRAGGLPRRAGRRGRRSRRRRRDR
ncbi:MAG TPA: hypothetical protein VF188_02000 [Longimicrobiales bacterium]